MNSGAYSRSRHKVSTSGSLAPANKLQHRTAFFNCWYTNAGSLNNKWDQFKASLVFHNHPHIVFVTETWFSEASNSLMKLDKYTLFSRERKDRSGGGVAIYVRNDLNATEASTKALTRNDAEHVWCVIKLKHESILVGCIYRPPQTTQAVNRVLNNAISAAKATVLKGKHSCILLAGDFNHPFLEWSDQGGNASSRTTDSNRQDLAFLDTIESCFLSQFVLEPTYKENTLDLVMTDDHKRMQDVKILAPLGSTVQNQLHATITWKFILEDRLEAQSTRHKPNFKKANFIELNKHFDNLDWRTIHNNNDSVDENYSRWLEQYQNATNIHVPQIRINTGLTGLDLEIKNNPEVRKAIKLKHSTFAKARASPKTQLLKSNYKAAAKSVKKLVFKVRCEFEQKIANNCKSNPKQLYNYINSQKKCKDQIRMLKENGLDLVNGQDIANCLNKAFHSVFNSVPRDNDLPSFPKRCAVLCDPSPDFLSPTAVYAVLKELDRNKSTGIDQVHPHVLKECASSISYSLSSILQQSFITSKLPQLWREANVTPIYKKGSRSDPLNYRPISLTSVACKVMEKLVKEIVLNHFISNELFTPHQHGFTRGKSCTTNLLETLDVLTNALDLGLEAIIIFLDFAKAFDVVPHEELLLKLESYGIVGNLLKWISAFLLDRRQRVAMGDSISDWMPVTSGVPQGSVLGPLLFLIFINDMPEVVRNLVKLFADDTKLLSVVESKTDKVLLQDDLDRLVDWSVTWRMHFNQRKCKVMRIAKKSAPTDLHLPFTMTDESSKNTHYLEETRSERDLGIQVKHNLKWDDQVKSAAAKANKALGTLQRTFKCWDLQMLKQLYVVYVRPHLEYAVQAWCPYNQLDINRLERVQFRATRLVHSLRQLDYEERLAVLGLPTMAERWKRADAIQMFKFDTGLNKVSWLKPFRSNQQAMRIGPSGSTRQIDWLVGERCSIKQRENFFCSRAVDTWNKLPASAKTAPTKNSFKRIYDDNTELDRRKQQAGGFLAPTVLERIQGRFEHAFY